jgi:hypothetical protein
MDHGHCTKEEGIHTTRSFEYANAAARLGDSSLVAADIGKIAIQTDNSSVWFLLGVGPLSWLELSASPLKLVTYDIDLTTAGNPIIDTRPATPTGNNRWKLVSIDLRVKVALSGGTTPTAQLSIGSTSGGTQIILDQVIDSSVAAGTIVGGFALTSLGAALSQATGFEAMYPAGQSTYANVAVTGSPTTGTVTAYLLWQGLP